MRSTSKEDEMISNYIEIETYNKEKEMQKKYAEGKVTEQEARRYDNTFRVEIRMRNGKINSEISKAKQKGQSKSKTLEQFYNEDATNKLYNNYIPRIFGINDYYRIDEALQVINDQKNLRETTKTKLCELLLLINKKGYSNAQKLWTKKYSENTFRNHIKKIEEFGVNVLTFDNIINR